MRERWTGWAFSILLTLSPISMTIFTLWTEIPLVESFLKTVEGLAARLYEQGPTRELMGEINKRLVGWLLNHIKTEDAKVAKYIQSKQGNPA